MKAGEAEINVRKRGYINIALSAVLSTIAIEGTEDQRRRGRR